jgi:heterodisulfide reductase subunit B
VGNILEAAELAHADAIVVACPLCHANLDMRQEMAEQRKRKKYGIPIIYISQLVGLAQGKDYHSLGLDKHMVSTESFVKRIPSSDFTSTASAI